MAERGVTTMTIAICGGQIITALGNRQQSWDGLCAGRSGLTQLELAGFGQQWPIAVCDLPGAIGSEERLQSLLSQLLADVPNLPAASSIICATTKGAADELLTSGQPTGQPYDLAALLKERFSGVGQVDTVSAACASGTLAIIQGAMRLAAGECEVVLVIGLDLVSRFVLAGFASLQALSASGCRPFADDRDGLSLGEGGGWLLLAKEETAHGLGLAVQAHLTGWGTACDATHITAPCRHASGLIATLQQIIGQGEGQVGGINAHGTGTNYNDAMELTAFNKLFPASLPVHSVKGGIGHCLGGAGVIEAVIALESLHHNKIPPTVGFNGVAQSQVGISGQHCQPLLHPAIISCNSGFGGINAGVMLAAI